MSVDPATGAVTQSDGKDGCLTSDGSSFDGPDTCTDIHGGTETVGLTLSPDQAFGYIVDQFGFASIVVLSRQASPVCSDVAGATPFATPFAFALPCSDPNGDPFTREIVVAPGHGSLGTLDQSSGRVTYTPANGFSGADSLTFRAVDAASAGAPATAAVTVATAPPPITTPSPDRIAPSCARVGAGRLPLARLTVRVRCGEAATLAAKLTLPRRIAKRLRIPGVKIAAGRSRAAADVPAGLKLKLKRKAGRRLKKLSRAELRKLRPRLTITATDAALNAATQRAKVRLMR